jgi:hypothetical protein
VSDERHIIFFVIFFAVKPGVPLGTMMHDTSFLPSPFWPVMHCTVQTPAILDVELVMNILLPLMTHLPFSSFPFVLLAPASEPASGSVRPKEARISPLQSRGSHSIFCFSLPK